MAFGITLAQYALLIGAGWFAWWRPWAFGLAAGVFGTLLYALLAGIVTLQAGETPEAALAVAAGLSTLLVLYALVGRAQHRIGWLFFLALLVMGWWWQGWYVWAVLVLIVIRLKHPPVLDPHVTLDPPRKIAGWLAVALLVGCFVPVPFVF